MKGIEAEDILAALLAHGQQLDGRRPDPLVEAVRESKVGRVRAGNWRAVRGPDGKIDVAASWPSLRTALGRDHRRINKNALHEVAADALLKMPKRPWQVLQTAIGANLRAREDVVAWLTREAWRAKKRDRYWPDKVARKACSCHRAAAPNYMHDLVQLAVLQLEHPIRFKTHDQRAQWFGLSNPHWRAVMQKPYDTISAPLWSKYHEGIGHIELRLASRSRRAETA